MKHRKSVLVVVLLSVVLVLCGGVVAYYELRQPPLQKLRQAMDSLEAARTAGADRWASETLRSARRSLTAGQQAVAEVNASWWPFHSYHAADSLLTESIRMSNLAVSQVGAKKTHRTNNTAARITRLDDSLKVWRNVLDNVLPRAEDALLYRSACFDLQMAKNMLEKKQHEAAGNYADNVRDALGTLQQSHQQYRSSSRQLVEQSHDWVVRTVNESRISGKTALIVDKSRHLLYSLSAGRVIDSMACDLGYNSGQQKGVKGDGATPEGMYRVTKVNRGSKYYRALLLDYPNEDDQRRFQANLSAGTIPEDSEIGGLIEVHGHGGVGRDWTDGCVAVTNHDMDKLLRVASTGTPVTIVRVWEKR